MPEDRVAAPGTEGAARQQSAGIPRDLLRRMYLAMVYTRTMDERAMKLQRAGRIGFHVPSTGQEAAAVGTAAALQAEDWVFPSYREPAVAILRGVPPVELFHNLFGNRLDQARGRQMPVHYSLGRIRFVSVSSPIGTQIIQAAGAAMASRIRRDGRVMMTWFGDGATSSSDFHTGLNFAGVFRAPCVFVCTNNQWAISLPVERQTASETIAVKAEAYGFPGVRVDGNDVMAVYEAARVAVERARRGDGPTLIECLTWRVGPHSSSDDPGRYRPEATTEEWRKKDPIERLKRHLLRSGVLAEEEDQAIREEARRSIDEAVRVAEATPPPAPESLFQDVYAEIPPHLVQQRAELLETEGIHGAAKDENAAFPL